MENKPNIENVKKVIDVLLQSMDSKEISTDIKECDLNVFLENNLNILKSLSMQAPYGSLSDKVSEKAIREIQKLNRKEKLNSIEDILDDLSILFMMTENITYSFDNHYIIENILNRNMEHFLDRYFEKEEGISCSHDKTVHTIHMILKGLLDDSELSLYEEYIVQENNVEVSKRAYWVPVTLKTNKEAISKFNEWYLF